MCFSLVHKLTEFAPQSKNVCTRFTNMEISAFPGLKKKKEERGKKSTAEELFIPFLEALDLITVL